MGTCNPKTLVGFMKALNAYFDQLAGSYPLMWIFCTYINAEFLANNMSVAFPATLDALKTALSSGNRWGPATNDKDGVNKGGKGQYVPGITTGTLPDVSG